MCSRDTTVVLFALGGLSHISVAVGCATVVAVASRKEIEAMEREETACSPGMTMDRSNRRRVLTALRVLLAEPGPKQGRSGAAQGHERHG